MSSSSSQPQAPSTVRTPSVTKWIIVFILRIVVLSGFAAGAIALGLIAGHFTPTNNPQKPLFLRLLANNFTGITSEAKPELNQTVANLSEEERTAIAAEIEGIEAQLQVLATRTQKLESELDLQGQTGALANRLGNLTTLIETNPDEFIPSTASNNVPDNDLKITLPSSVLFNNQGQLSAEAEELLGAIAIDLQQTRLTTIKIAGHSFPENAEQAEALSFQQAQSVKAFLGSQIEGNYRWLVVGYGDSQPIGTDDPSANQRIEIITQKD